MTDEEMQRLIKEVGEGIDKLSGTDDKLTKDEKRRKEVLLLRREALERMKEAREKKNWNQELTNAVTYSLLTSLGEKHPFLLHIMSSKLRMNLLQ